MTMRGLLVERLSTDLSGCRLADLPLPVRKAGQVLVKMRGASLNFPDLLMTRGEYQLRPPLPFVAGLEVAGEVVEADPDGGFAPGDAVVGGGKTGMMADFAVLEGGALRKIAPGIGFATAAAFGAAYQTAYVSLVELGQLQPGQTVLVHGATGGVGLAALDLAQALGAKVIATSGSADKLALVRRDYAPMGTILAEGRFRDEVAELTGGRLCDLVYDPVGGDVFDESTRCVAFGGKLLVVGFAGGRIPEISVNILLIKGFSVVGVRAGEYGRRFPDRLRRIRETIFGMLEAGKLKPRIDRVLPLERWEEGFRALERREVVGKVVFEP
jgi:NADPH2:quinone reductase